MDFKIRIKKDIEKRKELNNKEDVKDFLFNFFTEKNVTKIYSSRDLAILYLHKQKQVPIEKIKDESEIHGASILLGKVLTELTRTKPRYVQKVSNHKYQINSA